MAADDSNAPVTDTALAVDQTAAVDQTTVEVYDSGVPIIVRDETLSLTQTYRFDMSEVAANARVEVERERTKATVAKFATPARWSAGALVLIVMVTVGAIVHVCTLGLGDVQLAIACLAIGGTGAGTAAILRKVLASKLTPGS